MATSHWRLFPVAMLFHQKQRKLVAYTYWNLSLCSGGEHTRFRCIGAYLNGVHFCDKLALHYKMSQFYENHEKTASSP